MSELLFSVSVGGQAAVTYTDVITHRNVSFILDRQMPVVRSCLGEPAVISSEAFTIIAMSPASTSVSGAKGAFVAHGAMLDPGDLVTSGQQGFDALLGENDGAGQSVSHLTYDPFVNVDPAQSGPLGFAAGASGSVVKSVRLGDVTETSGEWQTIEKYVVLSVLPAVPAAGFFRPGMGPGAKIIHGTEAQVSYDILRTLSFSNGIFTQAEAEAAIHPTSPLFGLSNGETLRRLDIEGGSNYSRDFGLKRADAHAFLHLNRTDSAKRLTLLRSIQHGIDLAQAQANGYGGFGGAGQNYGRSFFSYVAAFGLQSAPLLAAAQAMGGGALRQHFWALSSELEQTVQFPAGSSDSHRHESPLLQSDLNIPEWDRDTLDPTRRDADPNARYRGFWPIGMFEALNVALLQNGPGGISGAQAILGGGAFDETNPMAAGFAFYDRARKTPQDIGNGLFGDTPDRLARWDNWRPLVGLTPWTGRPDWVSGNAEVTAGNGQITYDWSDHIWATEPITRRDLRFSLDGRQWITQQDVPAIGTLTGVTRGLEHHVSFRLVSASGAGRWSPTYPTTGPNGSSPALRNTVAPTGSQTASAPVNTVAPRILVRALEAWGGSDLLDAGSTYTAAQLEDKVTLYAGLGYWTGFPAPVFSYQWQSDGSDIAGETNDSISLHNRFALSQTDLTCRITGSDGVTQVTATTQAIALPEIAPPGPFVADFALGNASAGFIPTANAVIIYDAQGGALQMVSNGAFQGVSTPALEVVQAQSYRMDIDVDNTSNGTVEVVVGSTPNEDDILPGSAMRLSSGATGRITETITAPGDTLFIQTRLRGNGNGTAFQLIRVALTPV